MSNVVRTCSPGALAAEGLKPCTLELGGHAPVLVFDDADIERAVKALLIGKVRNAGQVCTSPTRLLIQDGIFDDFTQRFAAALKGVKVGNGLESGVDMGPLANERRLHAVQDLIAEAVSVGARVREGGAQPTTTGHFMRPTLLTDVPLSAAVMNAEPFGPLVLAHRFSTAEDALAEANRVPYGLASYAFTSSAATAALVGEEIQAGGVGINTTAISLAEAPFGGVKDSGYGVEGGPEGLMSYLHSKFIHHVA